jgi:hypothetical protein
VLLQRWRLVGGRDRSRKLRAAEIDDDIVTPGVPSSRADRSHCRGLPALFAYEKRLEPVTAHAWMENWNAAASPRRSPDLRSTGKSNIVAELKGQKVKLVKVALADRSERYFQAPNNMPVFFTQLK